MDNEDNHETSRAQQEVLEAMRCLCRPLPSVQPYAKMSLQAVSQSDNTTAILVSGSTPIGSVHSACLHAWAPCRAANDRAAVQERLLIPLREYHDRGRVGVGASKSEMHREEI